jgi:2-ketoarginine methyltransferase
MKPEIANALTRLKGYAESRIIFECLRLGILDKLSTLECRPANALRGNWNASVFQSLLEILAHAGLIELTADGLIKLTEDGRNSLHVRGYYELLVGGYDGTIRSIEQLLNQGPDTNVRDFEWVAKGSAGIAKFDSIPLTLNLTKQLATPPDVIVDLGCGNASYLVEYTKWFPTSTVRGCDLALQSVAEAKRYIENLNLACRISIQQCDATEYIFSGDEDLIILAFALHEVLGQANSGGVEQFLNRIRISAPNARILLIEVEPPLPQDPASRSLSRMGYYNLYNLMQVLTQQTLQTQADWEAIFDLSGYKCEARQRVDQSVDDSLLEFGLLFAPK